MKFVLILALLGLAGCSVIGAGAAVVGAGANVVGAGANVVSAVVR